MATPPVAAPDWALINADPNVQQLLELALREDLGEAGDITTAAIFTARQAVAARVVARAPTVVCGVALARELFSRIDPDLRVSSAAGAREGAWVEAGATLCTLRGDVRSILSGERCVLNFLMRLCGIATATRRAVERVPATAAARIFDTRKTAPGWRRLDKAAVATGGGANHRFGLHDGVLIKDNHVAAAGGVAEAVRRARGHHGDELPIEVEIDSLAQLEEALGAEPEVILLDNFSTAELAEAVRRTGGRAILEASGGLRLEDVATVAQTGVDRISMGWLTHTVSPADLSLEVAS